MITTTARHIAFALLLPVREAARFLKRYLVFPHVPQDYLVAQRVANRRQARRDGFGAGGH